MWEAELLRFAGGSVGLVGLGLVMGISPTLIAVALHTLTSARRPVALITAMLIGLASGATALLLVLQVFDPRTLEALLQRDVEEVLVQRGVDLLVGALFLVAAAVLARRLRKPRQPRPPRAQTPERPWRMALIGASNAVIGVSGIATMYMTARVLRGVSEDDGIRLVAYVIFVIALVAPYALLAWAWRRLPRLAGRLTAVFDRVAAMDRRPWEFGIVLLAGLVFLGLGVWGAPAG